MSNQQNNKSGLYVLGPAMVLGVVLVWACLMYIVGNSTLAWVAAGVVAGIDTILFMQIKKSVDDKHLQGGGNG